MHDLEEKVGPYGESVVSDAYRDGVQKAARSALEMIAAYRRDAIDPLSVCRAFASDPYLREIAPTDLLLGFRGVDSEFDADLDETCSQQFEPVVWAELTASRDAYFASRSGSIAPDCEALAAHLERWQRDHPPQQLRN